MRKSISDSSAPDLIQLVKENKFSEIQETIKQIKILDKWNWYFRDEVKLAIRDAVILQQVDTVKYFLDEGFPPSSFYHDEKGPSCSLTTYAVNSGKLLMVVLLVERGADIKPEDRSSFNRKGDDGPIQCAFKHRHINIFEYLLKNGANPNSYCQFNDKHRDILFLEKSAIDEDTEVMQLLISHGAQVSYAINSIHEHYFKWRNHETENPEYKKDLSDYAKVISTLLDYAFGVDFRYYHEYLNVMMDVSGMNFVGVSFAGKPVTHETLIKAGFKGAKQALVTIKDIEKLSDKTRGQSLLNRLKNKSLEQGSLIDSAGTVNLLPLYRAAKVGNVPAVIARLNAGIDPNGDKQYKEFPIVIAAENGHLAAIKALTEHPKFDKEIIGKAIQAARINSHPHVVEYLLAHRDIDAADEEGNTSLHLAIKRLDSDLVEKLIKKGAKVNIKNNSTTTPLCELAKVNCLTPSEFEARAKIIGTLLSAGADPNDFAHSSPLENVVEQGDYKSAALLMPVTTKKDLIRKKLWNCDKEGVDPWYVDMMFQAVRNKSLEILTLLKEYGPDFNIRNQYGNVLLNEALEKLPTIRAIAIEMDDARHRGCFVMGGGRISQKEQDEQAASYRENLMKRTKASFQGALAMIEFLVLNGANINLPDEKSGLSPLILLSELHEQNISEFEAEYAKVRQILTKDVLGMSNDSISALVSERKKSWGLKVEAPENIGEENLSKSPDNPQP